jgi:hypothetical protein
MKYTILILDGDHLKKIHLPLAHSYASENGPQALRLQW